jgi:hypothetical protein
MKMTYKEHWGKRDWVYALTLFVVFTVAFFLSSLLIEGHALRYAVVSGLIHGVVFAGLWWLMDVLIAANKKKSNNK